MHAIAQLNHVALQVADLERSKGFYREVIGLHPIPRPAFSFPGAWFRIGADQELHLIQGPADTDHAGSRGNHFAMKVASMPEAEAHLRAQGVEFTGPKPRPDGALQIFLHDPDGHVLELCMEAVGRGGQ